MHILLLSTYFAPDIASTGQLMAQLAVELEALGHQVTVLTGMPHYGTGRIPPPYHGKLYMRENWNGIDVRRVYLYPAHQKSNLFQRWLNYTTFNLLSAWVGAFGDLPRCDVILTSSPPLTNGLVASWLSRWKRVPFVYGVQDVYPDVAIRLGVLKNRVLIAFFEALERFVYRRASAVSVISETFRRNLEAKGVPPDKIAVIPNFADTHLVTPLPRHNPFSARNELDDAYVVLFAGNVGLSHGLESILEAARLLASQKDILFLIVGDGAAKPRLQALASKARLPNVRFLPFQPQADVPWLYASSDVCLVPLRRGFTENSAPSKLYTILAAARPVIAAVDPGSDTWTFIQETDCGLLLPPESPAELAAAVQELRDTPELGREMGSRGRDRILAEATAAVAAGRYCALLEQVCGRARDCRTGAPLNTGG